jgi:hypothetical protein
MTLAERVLISLNPPYRMAMEAGGYFEVVHVDAHDLHGTQAAVLLRRPRQGQSRSPSAQRKGLHGLGQQPLRRRA